MSLLFAEAEPPVKREDRIKRGVYIVNVLLHPEEDEFLSSLGKETREQGGRKLGKSEILRGLTLVLKELVRRKMIDLTEIKGKKEFVQRLRKAMGLE